MNASIGVNAVDRNGDSAQAQQNDQGAKNQDFKTEFYSKTFDFVILVLFHIRIIPYARKKINEIYPKAEFFVAKIFGKAYNNCYGTDRTHKRKTGTGSGGARA